MGTVKLYRMESTTDIRYRIINGVPYVFERWTDHKTGSVEIIVIRHGVNNHRVASERVHHFRGYKEVKK